MKKIGMLLLILVLLAIPAQAAVFTYTDEASYLAKLTELSYGSISEGFEDNAVWSAARSPSTAPAVLSQGIAWTSNNQATSSSELTTGFGAARTGSWGVYSIPHGDTSVTAPLGFKHDGWVGNSADTIYGAGGWVDTNTPYGALEMILDGNATRNHDFGVVGTTSIFIGMIDTNGFTSFEVRETEGQFGDEKYIYGDDFTIATGNTTVPPPPTDTTAPIITLLGDAIVNVTQGEFYDDAGATAWDETDGNITANIITKSDVDTSIINTYEVKYDVTDAAGNIATTVKREVNVVAAPPPPADTTAPVITLLGEAVVNVTEGDAYVDAGATASDDTDGNITSSIITVNPVNTSTPGPYTITYDVSDIAGNPATQVTRTVNVQALPLPLDTTAPVITLIGNPVVNVTEGDTYNDAGASATDETNGDLTTNITTVNLVDTSIPGNYTVTYDVNDSSGNAAAQVTRMVVVQSLPPSPPLDTTAPVISLIGDAIVNILEGSIYNDAGATAFDETDGNLTANIVTVNPVDTSIPGPYTVTYDVSDVANNTAAQVSRTVNVEALPPPPDVPEEITALIGLLEEKRDELAAAGEEEAADALQEIIDWLSGLTVEDIKDLKIKTGKKMMVQVKTDDAQFKYEDKHVGHDKIKVEQEGEEGNRHVKVTDGGFSAKLELEV